MIKCFYHAHCADGIGAAWAVYKTGQEAEFIPIGYDTALRMESLEGQDVLAVDFSFKPEVLAELLKIAKTVTIIDHHQTAYEYMINDYPNIPLSASKLKPYIDRNHSGAVLAWKHFFPGKDIPEILLYIEDRDRWQWNLEYSKEISGWLTTKSWDRPQLFDAYAEELFGERGTCLKIGKAVAAYIDKQVEKVCNNATTMKFDGYTAWSAQSPLLQSEIGHYLLKEKACDLAVIWNEGVDKIHVSLRSTDKIDVSILPTVKKYKGGGHKTAAGFSIPTNDIDSFGLHFIASIQGSQEMLDFFAKHPIHTKQALLHLKWLMDSIQEVKLVDTPYWPPKWPNKPRP